MCNVMQRNINLTRKFGNNEEVTLNRFHDD